MVSTLNRKPLNDALMTEEPFEIIPVPRGYKVVTSHVINGMPVKKMFLQRVGSQEDAELTALAEVFEKKAKIDQQKALEAIDGLDFSMIKEKLCKSEEQCGHGWEQQRADEAIAWYRKFLKLAVLTDAYIVPTKDIDQVWHTAILFTRKYAEDCQKVYGRFLHHQPTIGQGDNHEDVEETINLFIKHFGESPMDKLHWCCFNNCSQCGQRG